MVGGPRHPHARGRLVGRILLNFHRSGCSLEAIREGVERMAGPISKRARRSVLAHVDANLEALAATPSTSGSSRQGRTTHFTTYYSNGLLIHEPGDVIQLTSTNGWRTSWSIVTPGKFTDRAFSDLLFYDPAAGVGEMYVTDGHGGMSLIATNTGWRTSWSMIIPCSPTAFSKVGPLRQSTADRGRSIL